MWIDHVEAGSPTRKQAASKIKESFARSWHQTRRSVLTTLVAVLGLSSPINAQNFDPLMVTALGLHVFESSKAKCFYEPVVGYNLKQMAEQFATIDTDRWEKTWRAVQVMPNTQLNMATMLSMTPGAHPVNECDIHANTIGIALSFAVIRVAPTPELLAALDRLMKSGKTLNTSPTGNLKPESTATYIFKENALQRTGKPEQSVRIGELISLKNLGRRFPEASVSAAYTRGDEDVEFYKLKQDDVDVSLFYENGGKIIRIESQSPGIADSNGIKVGHSLRLALGDRAYCNTHMEDQTAYCQKTKDVGLVYSISVDDKNCPFPQSKEGFLPIPPCLKVTAIKLTNSMVSNSPPVPKPSPKFSFADFPASEQFKDRTRLPNFNGRDKAYASYRTRVTNALNVGPNFADEFSLAEIGCGTACMFALLASNRTGEVYRIPVGGEDKPYTGLYFKRDSRLLIAQSGSYVTQRCNVEYFEWTKNTFKHLVTYPIGDFDLCYKNVRENIKQ